MISRTLPTLATLAVLLAACGGDRPSADEAPVAATGPLSLLLDVPDTVRAGQSVPITATLVNNGREPVALELGGSRERPSLDVVVTRPDGGEVWRRSRSEELPSSAFDWTLKPGEFFATAYAWDPRDNEGQALPPGSYRVRGILSARPRDLATPEKTLVVAR